MADAHCGFEVSDKFFLLVPTGCVCLFNSIFFPQFSLFEQRLKEAVNLLFIEYKT